MEARGKRKELIQTTRQWLQQLELQFHQALQCQSSNCIFPEQVTIPQRFMCTHGNRLVGERGERSFPQHFYDKTNKQMQSYLSLCCSHLFGGEMPL